MDTEGIKKLSSNLKKILAIREITVLQLAKELNRPQPTISRIVNGDTKKPKEKIIKQLAKFFNISELELIGEREIEWGNIGGWINTIIGQNRKIPLFSWILNDNYNLQLLDKEIGISVSNPVSDKAFSLKVKDTSMEPLFPLNSIIVCDPLKEASHGSYVIIKLKDDRNLVFRKLLKDMQLNYIKPLNKDFGSDYIHRITPHDEILATVVHVQYDIV